jgi:WD40 repeat protein
LTGHTGWLGAVAFSADGKLLASAGDDNNHGSVRLWNPATGQPVGAPLTGHTAVANAVAFSRDGKLLASAGSDGNDEGGIVRLWNPAIGQPVGAPMTGPTGVGAVAFSPDGKLLASASLRDGHGAVEATRGIHRWRSQLT